MDSISNVHLNLENWLTLLAEGYPLAIYFILFLILFSESAFFPLGPFLPGDGLLLTTGVLAANGYINLWLVILVLVVGVVLGNIVAWWLGIRFGPYLFERFSWLNQHHYEQARVFYRKHGNKAFLISRFIPIVRALVPFVAGVAQMSRIVFMRKNIISAIVWVMSLNLAGFYLGQLPFIQEQFSLFMLLIIGLSFIPLLLFIIRSLWSRFYKR